MKGRKSRWVLGGMLAGVVLIAAIVVAMILHYSRQPGFDSFVPAFSTSILAQLDRPLDGSSYPADASIPIALRSTSGLPIQAVELWINGKLFGTQPPGTPGATSFLAQWHWEPGTVGTYVLMGRVTDSSGHAGVSAPVTIAVTAAAGYTKMISSQAGDTLNSLAVKNGIPPEKIVQANPQLTGPSGGSGESGPAFSQAGGLSVPAVHFDLDTPLPPDTIVFIPHLSLPAGLPDFSLGSGSSGQSSGQSGGGSSGQAPSQAPFEKSTGFTPSFFNKLSFQIGKSVSPASGAPAAPRISLYTEMDGSWDSPCHPAIMVERNSKDEDGYYLYRSGGGSQLKRIATLPKVDPGYAGQTYLDQENISGVFTYVASAFNTAGESFSQPLVVDLSNCDYTPESSRYLTDVKTTGGVGLENGILTLPGSVNLAYLYIGINGTYWQRVPPGSSNFLNGSGYQFSLDKYLASIVDQVDATDLDITIEVWGWQGGEVGKIGTLSASIHRVVLEICSQAGENQCAPLGGSAGWVKDVFLPTGQPVENQFYNLRLMVSPALQARDLLYQVFAASGPGGVEDKFSSWQFCDYNIQRCGDLNTLAAGQAVFLPFSMGNYYNLPPGSSGPDLMDYFANNRPFEMHIRVSAVDMQGNPGMPSDTVVIHYQTPADSDALPLASSLPSLYTVEIQRDTYQLPVFLNGATWGCVVVQNNVDDYYAGEVVCPPARDTGPGSWDAWSLITGEADLIAQGFSDMAGYLETLKDDIVSAVAYFIPGCGDDCKSYLKKGLNAGITALTGLPPSLPNFDELASQGILYTVDQVQSSLTGYECGSDCVNALKSQLASAIHDARQLASQPGCTAVDQVAWFYGKQPGWCLPPEVEVEPYPGGSNQPGTIVVKVTRNSTPAPSGDLASQYFLDVSAQGTNTARKGTLGNECVYAGDGYQVDRPDEYYLYDHVYSFYKDQEQGDLYSPVRIPMPDLQPGESILIPIQLQPLGYDTTKETYMPDLDCNGFARFEYLFYKGTSTITAAEYCAVAENGSVVPCTNGGSDVFTTTNPNDPSDQWP